jgi:ethanolamine utilization cobalamin adenosyltransferase
VDAQETQTINAARDLLIVALRNHAERDFRRSRELMVSALNRLQDLLDAQELPKR